MSTETDVLGAGPRYRQRVEGDLRPLKDGIIIEDMHFGQRTTAGGIILLDDDGKDQGIRPRWARVYRVGPEQKDVKPGQWILISHGRWTRAIEMVDPETGENRILRRADPAEVLAVSDEVPTDETMGIN